jgi:hypothetical protein
MQLYAQAKQAIDEYLLVPQRPVTKAHALNV